MFSSLWFFSFAVDLTAKSCTIDCDACSSGRPAGISVLLWFESITNWCDPWEILTQEWELSCLRDQNLISIPCLSCWKLVVTSNTGPISRVSLNPSFWLWWSVTFWRKCLEKVYSMSFIMKYCPITTCTNLASIQNLLTLLSCESISIRSSFGCIGKFWCAGSSFSEGISHNRLTHHHIRLPQSISKRFLFFTHVRDCSLQIELTCRNNYAKNNFNYYLVDCKVYRQFSVSFAFELAPGQWSRCTENLDIHFLRIPATSRPRCDPTFIVGHSFPWNSTSSRNLDHCPIPNFFASMETTLAFAKHSSLSFVLVKVFGVSPNLNSKCLT